MTVTVVAATIAARDLRFITGFLSW